MQLYMSEGKLSRKARRWAWGNRPITSLDNPVKRYLGNRPAKAGLKEPHKQFIRRLRMVLRPAV